MDPYIVGAFLNNCRISWKSVEGFEDAVSFIKSIDNRVSVNNNLIILTSGCEEIENIRSKPLRLLLIYDARDWIKFLRGLYDFNGELFDPEPSLNVPNLILILRVLNTKIGQLLRIVLKFLGISSDLFKGEDGLSVVIHDKEALARFIKTVKPHVDPKLNIALNSKWVRFYENVGEPLITVETQSV